MRIPRHCGNETGALGRALVNMATKVEGWPLGVGHRGSTVMSATSGHYVGRRPAVMVPSCAFGVHDVTRALCGARDVPLLSRISRHHGRSFEVRLRDSTALVVHDPEAVR